MSRGVQRLLGYRLEVGDLSVAVSGVLAAALTLAVVWLLARGVQRAFNRHAREREIRRRAAIYTVARITRYTLYAIGAVVALELLGIPMSRFALLAGAVGVGLGFGLQAIFSNFVSGIILLFERSVRVGDFVELASGVHGEVRDINIRSTLVLTNDNVDILVPNSEFVTGRVVNWTHRDLSRRVRIPFNVAYGSDKEVVKKAALEAAAEVPFTLALEGERRPQVWLVGFGKDSLEFELVVWQTPDATKRPSAARASYLWALESALHKYGLEVPFPQRDLNVRSLFGLRGEEAFEALRRPQVAGAPEHPPEEAPVELDARERAELAGNDALEEVERCAREEAERKAAESAEAEAEAAAEAAADVK